QLAARQFEESARYRNDLHYWLAKLQGLPAGPALPMSTSGLHRCERLTGTLEAVQWQALKQRAVALNVSPTALLLGIFAEVLRAWSERKAFTLVLTFFNRMPVHPQIEQVLGPFISTTLFVVEKNETDSLEHRIRHTQKTLFADLDHSAVSGIRVLRELKRSNRLESTLPLPVVFTSLLGKKMTRDSRSFLENISYAVTQTPQVYLDHQMYELDGQLRFSWDVARDYFADGVIDAVFADYCRVLGELAGNTGQWPPELSACGPRNTEACAIRFETFPERRGRAFPLTDLQQAYAFGKSPHSANMSSRIYSAIDAVYLDTDRLQQALQQLLAAHEMLVAVVGPDGTWKTPDGIPAYTIPVADLRGEQPERIATTLADIEREMMAANCALGAWPHFELRVSHLDAVHSIVHFSVELLIADAVSIGLLRKQLCHFYHHAGDKPDLSISYTDYLWSLENYRQSAGYQASMDYWERKFADIPPGPKLPLRDKGITHGTERLEAVLDNWVALKTMAAQLSVTPGMVLLTAYAEVLAAWSDGQPFSIVMPSWHRLPLHEDIDQLVGDFTAMVWLAVEHQAGSFADKVQRNHRLVQQDLAHRAVSGLKALRKQALKRRNSGPLSFPVVFTDLEPDAGYELPDGFRLRKTLSQTAQVDLDNISSDYGERLGLHWDVAQGRYPDGVVQDMFAAYRRLLAQLACDPESWQETDFSFLSTKSTKDTK
ncbi:MAG: polyketide synthase, partial [Methylovulum sp.]